MYTEKTMSKSIAEAVDKRDGPKLPSETNKEVRKDANIVHRANKGKFEILNLCKSAERRKCAC